MHSAAAIAAHDGCLTGASYPRATGLAVLRAYQNLKEVPPGPAVALFDATWKAGRTTDLALRMRRHGSLSAAAVEAFGRLVSLGASDLRAWALPLLGELELIDYGVGPDGGVSEIAEHVGVEASVLDQAAAIWRRLAPEPVEACAIASADHATYAPLALSDHQAALESEGFPEELHEPAFQALRAVGLLRREPSVTLGEEVLWAPYVWGTEAVDIAAFMRRLPTNEREALGALSRTAADHPGLPVEQLGGDDRLVRAARHAGLLDATRVISGTRERGFAFPPGLEHRIAGGLTDATHERKLFVAHILNGHIYGDRGTGRIVHPLPFVDVLISEGAVGPTTAAGRDYGLLEAAGIVRVEEVGRGQAILHLVKRDVAEDSRELLRLALAGDGAADAGSVDALWIPGSALATPEGDRHRLPPPRGAEGEVIHSTLMELRREIGRRVRREEP